MTSIYRWKRSLLIVQNPWPVAKATTTNLKPNQNSLWINGHIQIENAKILWL